MLIAGVALLSLVPVLMVWFLLHGAPFVRTSDDRTKIIVKEAGRLKPERIVDLGCGDGKLVIALAKAGYKVDGIEIQPWLVRRAKRAVKKAGLEAKVNIYWGSFWNLDTSEYDLAVIFGVQHIMTRLEKKLKSEMPAKSYIISNSFIFPGLRVKRRNGKVRTYII